MRGRGHGQTRVGIGNPTTHGAGRPSIMGVGVDTLDTAGFGDLTEPGDRRGYAGVNQPSIAVGRLCPRERDSRRELVGHCMGDRLIEVPILVYPPVPSLL